MHWAELMMLDGLALIAVLIYYRNRPKPKWLSREISLAKAVGRFLHIIKMVLAKARI